VEDGRDVVGDVRMDRPDVFFRHGDELGETAVGVDPQNIDLFADVAVASAAGLADAAADVAFSADALANGCATDGGADCLDAADKFVAGRDAQLDAALAPGVPFVDMTVGAADPGVRYGDEHVAGPDLGSGRIALEPEAGFVFEFADGEHGEQFKVQGSKFKVGDFKSYLFVASRPRAA